MVKETLPVLRRSAEERPEPDELRGLRLHDAQRRLAKHYGIPGVEGLGVPQGDAAAGQPPRRRADDGQRAEGDGQRHHDLAGPARGLGARPHPGHAAAQADRGRARPSSRTSAAPRRSASNWPSTGSGAECASCHAKIDPPGFALESFDVIGGWRDYYRSVGKGEPVVVDGRTMRYLKGPKVDPADVLPDGRRFQNIDEFKQLLLKDKDQLARALAEKLLTYATGGAPETADQPEIEAIVAQDPRQELRLPDAGPRDRAEQGVSDTSRIGQSARQRCVTNDRGLSHETSPTPLPPGRRRVAGPALARRLRPPARRPLPPSRAAAWSASARRWDCTRAYFFPEKAGKDYELTPYLEVLKDFRDDFTVISGLSHRRHEPGIRPPGLGQLPDRRPGRGPARLSQHDLARPVRGRAHRRRRRASPAWPCRAKGRPVLDPHRRAGAGGHLAVERVRQAVPRRAARRSPGPGAPARGRPEHPRRRPRPGQDAAVRASAPTTATSSTSTSPASANWSSGWPRDEAWAKKPKPKVERQAAQGHPQRGRPHRPRRGCCSTSPTWPCRPIRPGSSRSCWPASSTCRRSRA